MGRIWQMAHGPKRAGDGGRQWADGKRTAAGGRRSGPPENASEQQSVSKAQTPKHILKILLFQLAGLARGVHIIVVDAP